MSEFLKGKNPHIAHKAANYFKQFNHATISLITRYEVLRG